MPRLIRPWRSSPEPATRLADVVRDDRQLVGVELSTRASMRVSGAPTSPKPPTMTVSPERIADTASSGLDGAARDRHSSRPFRRRISGSLPRLYANAGRGRHDETLLDADTDGVVYMRRCPRDALAEPLGMSRGRATSTAGASRRYECTEVGGIAERFVGTTCVGAVSLFSGRHDGRREVVKRFRLIAAVGTVAMFTAALSGVERVRRVERAGQRSPIKLGVLAAQPRRFELRRPGASGARRGGLAVNEINRSGGVKGGRGDCSTSSSRTTSPRTRPRPSTASGG